MKIRDLIKQLEDMLLIYGDRTILTITDIESEYSIKEIDGKMCAKYFEPSDHVAEVTVRIKRNSSIKTQPSVTPKPELCEDAVSRADVVDMLDMYPFTEYGEYETAREIVNRLPSVEPKHKTWKWIEYDSDEDKYDVIKCPCCKHTFTVDAYHWTDIGFVKDDFKFCPNCGSKNGDARNE